jgi:hypothetical protein
MARVIRDCTAEIECDGDDFHVRFTPIGAGQGSFLVYLDEGDIPFEMVRDLKSSFAARYGSETEEEEEEA